MNSHLFTVAYRFNGLPWYLWVTSTPCYFLCLIGVREALELRGVGVEVKQASEYISLGLFFFSVCDWEDLGAMHQSRMVLRVCSSNNTPNFLLVGRASLAGVLWPDSK